MGDDFFGIKRYDEAGEEYQEALRAYEMVLEADPEFAEARENKEIVQKYLDELPSDNFLHGEDMTETSEPGSENVTDRLANIVTDGVTHLIHWLSPVWEPELSGQLASAADIPKQDRIFATEHGDIKIVCQWDRQIGNEPAYLLVKWEVNIETDHGVSVRLTNPDTQETLYDIDLGAIRVGEEAFTAGELGFDPSREKWAVSVVLASECGPYSLRGSAS